MRSEGFAFIVGVWGWACVRVILLCRRIVVVVASLIRCHWAVHSHCDTILTFKIWKVEEVSHEMLVLALPSHKIWGYFRILRNRHKTLEASECKRVVFAWQAQHFVMWPFAMSWQAQYFVTWRRCCCHESQWQGCANMTLLQISWYMRRICCLHKSQWQGCANVTLLQISWQAQHFVSVLKSGGSFARGIFFKLCKNGIYKKNSREIVDFRVESVKFEGSLAQNAPFGASNFQGERSFSRFAWQAQDFRSSLLEKLRKSRTKCLFWKLLLWKVAEASQETLVLKACCLKSCGSLARNARFESLLLEKLRKPRTKRSFWKLVPWKVEETSHEMLVLEAFVLLCSTE